MRAFIRLHLPMLALIAALSPETATRRSERPPEPGPPAEERTGGVLQFVSYRPEFSGTDLGSEDSARRYVGGHPLSSQRAVWGFDTIPKGAATALGDAVPAKLTCAVFSTGRSARSNVHVTIRAVSHTCPQVPPTERAGAWQWAGDEPGKQSRREQYEEAVTDYRVYGIDPGAEEPDAASWKAANELAEKYGYYEVRAPDVVDKTEATVNLPAGLFRNALKNRPEARADGTPKRPLVSIYVKCETLGALIGVTEADLYLCRAPQEPPGERVGAPLQFKSRKADFTGIDVGKEFGARKYIPGHPNTPDRATWGFDTLPPSIKTPPDDTVPAKLTCSVFRTGKNTPPGVQVVVRAVSHTCPQAPDPVRGDWQWAGDKAGAAQKERYAKDLAAYKDKKIDPGAEEPDAASWKAANELAEKYGYYEITVPKVFDDAEATINLPAGLFRNALKNKPEANADGTPKRPLVTVYVKCETTGVFIGMTDGDLYLYPPKPAPKQ